MFSILQKIDWLIAGKISQIHVHKPIDQKIRCLDVPMVDVEYLMAGEDREHYLVYHPNCILTHILF